MWFEQLEQFEEPSSGDLVQFVIGVRSFLEAAIYAKDERFGFLWEGRAELQTLAMETYRYDILEGGLLDLFRAVDQLAQEQIRMHGLEGRPLKFKFRAISAVSTELAAEPRKRRFRGLFKKTVDVIDALLDSVISASGGKGGMVKEFKDTLRALA